MLMTGTNLTANNTEHEYLGDGVYASFDGYHVWLDLRAQGGAAIAIEPPVLNRLIEYAKRVGVKV